MTKKSYSKTKKFCTVTFRVGTEANAKTAFVCGDFNNWDKEASPLKALKDGGFSANVSLEAGKEYRFKYFVDGERWINDEAADKYVANEYGSEDSVITV